MIRRRALTLLELLVVIAIIGLLLALTATAVVKVREVAVRTSSMNNLRQIVLATHNCADNDGGRLPTVDGDLSNVGGNTMSPKRREPVFFALLPYIEQGNVLEYMTSHPGDGVRPVKTYLSPADPTIPSSNLPPLCSYPANAQVFQGYPAMSRTFQDGTSHTILYAEHYAYNCQGFYFLYTLDTFTGGFQVRRSTFADGGSILNLQNYGDTYPITRGSPPVSGPSDPDPATFQVAPTPPSKVCCPLVAQTPHRSGMLVALADGSVRTLAPGMSTATYWAAVTPAGGELMGNDW